MFKIRPKQFQKQALFAHLLKISQLLVLYKWNLMTKIMIQKIDLILLLTNIQFQKVAIIS